jgi:hypothetical protein
MKFICIFLVFFISACKSTPDYPKAGINQIYDILGAQVTSPNEPNWQLMQHNQTGIYFGKDISSKTNSLIANVLLYAVNGFDDDKKFLEYIIAERKKNDDSSRFVDLGVTYDFVTFNESSCVSYTSLAEDHKSQSQSDKKFQYFSTAGYICRHPANKGVAIQLETSYRSDNKLIPEYIRATSKNFFSGVKFIDNKVK